jgi:hypothetical protein
VAGFRISIRLCHIYEALRLEAGAGLVIRSTEECSPAVDEFIYKPRKDHEEKLEMTRNCKVIYKILTDSILSKLESSDQVSNLQKLFTFHVAKGNFVDMGKLIFIHLAESINSTKPIIRHARLLSHIFAQNGLYDAIRSFFPAYNAFLLSSKMVNSTTLRYMKLIKTSQIVHPTHPLLLRSTEEGIPECHLVHVSERDARKIVEAHADYLDKLGAEVGSGEPTDLTVRQMRILEKPSASVGQVKRKADKSPVQKLTKVKKTSVPRKQRTEKIKLTSLTKDEIEMENQKRDIELVEAFNKKEESLEGTNLSGIDPKEFDKMYEDMDLKTRQELLNKSERVTLYGPVNAQASGSTAPIIQNLNMDDDSDRTPSPPPTLNNQEKDHQH